MRVPRVERVGTLGNAAYLIMEFIPMTSQSDYAALGTSLAQLDAHKGDDRFGFGFHVENFVGLTPQKNMMRSDCWVDFFRVYRLQAQLDLLQERRLCQDTKFIQRLQGQIHRVGELFDQDELDAIHPSLLHGDLWAGNWGFTADGDQRQPVVFDPACYWGHNEAELAMMTLFGSLPADFYTSYFAILPKLRRFEDRVPLYQLYHALNHYNLFGASYQGLCEELLDHLERKLRPA